MRDEYTVDVTFSFAPSEVDAMNPAKYSCTGGVSVTSVLKLNSTQHRLTTTRQAIGTSYTLNWPV